MSKINNHCIFLRINLLKMSCGKGWKWHFRDPKFKDFLMGACPKTPLVWAAFGATTCSACGRMTPSKYHATPLDL